jgi:hypothetical protein
MDDPFLSSICSQRRVILDACLINATVQLKQNAQARLRHNRMRRLKMDMIMRDISTRSSEAGDEGRGWGGRPDGKPSRYIITGRDVAQRPADTESVAASKRVGSDYMVKCRDGRLSVWRGGEVEVGFGLWEAMRGTAAHRGINRGRAVRGQLQAHGAQGEARGPASRWVRRRRNWSHRTDKGKDLEQVAWTG